MQIAVSMGTVGAAARKMQGTPTPMNPAYEYTIMNALVYIVVLLGLDIKRKHELAGVPRVWYDADARDGRLSK